MRRKFIGVVLLGLVLSACGGKGGLYPSTKTYTVRWENWDGVLLETDSNVKEGSWPTYNGSTPHRIDDEYYTYSWSGWYPNLAPVRSNITYTATYFSEEKIVDYTITFDTRGGSTINPVSVRKGNLLDRPEDPTKDNYAFGGWYTDNTLTNEYDFSRPVNSSFTLYAKWNTTEYMVTYNLNYDNLPTVSYSTKEGYITYRPTRSGYVFNGWWLSDGFIDGQPILSRSFSFDTRVTSNNLVLYAEWVEEKMVSNELDAPVVTIDGDNISWNEVKNATKYQVIIEKSGIQHVNEQRNYTYIYFPSTLDAGKYTIKVRAIGDSVNYYNSQYTSKTYAHRILTSVTGIKFDESKGVLSWDEVKNADSYELIVDSVSILNTSSTQYNLGSLYAGNHTVKITASKYGWISSTGNIKFVIHRLTAPTNFSATLDEETLDYEVTWDEVRMDSGYANSYVVYLNGTEVETVSTNKYTIKHNSSYYIDYKATISVAAYDQNSDYLISPRTEELILDLSKCYFIIYELDGGTNNPSNPDTYNPEVGVTLENPIKDGYSFIGWYSDNKLVSDIPIGNIGPVFVEARWSPNLNLLSVTSEDVSKGTVAIISGSGYSNELITVTASPFSDCVFKGWYHDLTKVSDECIYTFVMPTNNYALVAHFLTNVEEQENIQKYATSPSLSSDGKTITYGLYPQNVVETSLYTVLENNAIKQPNGWYLHNGDYYARTVASLNKNYQYKFDNGEEICEGETYWFKCEPIVWDVLSNNNNEYYVISSILLDACSYYYFATLDLRTRIIDGNTIYSSNYMYSDIRAWLNNEFYNSAFSLGNERILTTIVDNGQSTTDKDGKQYVCDSTTDKIFLPSYKDYLNSSYNFSVSTSASQSRVCKITDWARARGYGEWDYRSSGFYWTRSPAPSEDTWYVCPDGTLEHRGWNTNYPAGVRPGLSVKII